MKPIQESWKAVSWSEVCVPVFSVGADSHSLRANRAFKSPNWMAVPLWKSCAISKIFCTLQNHILRPFHTDSCCFGFQCGLENDPSRFPALSYVPWTKVMGVGQRKTVYTTNKAAGLGVKMPQHTLGLQSLFFTTSSNLPSWGHHKQHNRIGPSRPELLVSRDVGSYDTSGLPPWTKEMKDTPSTALENHFVRSPIVFVILYEATAIQLLFQIHEALAARSSQPISGCAVCSHWASFAAMLFGQFTVALRETKTLRCLWKRREVILEQAVVQASWDLWSVNSHHVPPPTQLKCCPPPTVHGDGGREAPWPLSSNLWFRAWCVNVKIPQGACKNLLRHVV